MKQMELNIETKKVVGEQNTAFGIFIEDLNHALDGGIYGELVQNRSFEYDEEDHEGYHSMTAWEAVERGDSFVQVHTETAEPRHPNNPHYLVVEALSVDEGCGIRNRGYNKGIYVEKDKKYQFYCFCSVCRGESAIMEVRLEDESGRKIYASEKICLYSEKWTRYECTLTADQTDPCGRLTLLLMNRSTIHLDMVSLFPTETFRGRENGLRKDLAEMLENLKPEFIRFPGGCLTHVGSLDGREKSSLYRWKNTLGPVEERQSRHNVLWKYNQTFGMGIYEFFLFCEDIHAEPVPVISAGNDPHFNRAAAEENFQEWIDEALDLIEFANGSVNTRWGGVRAKMGHPESFHLKYLTIGNEETGEYYTGNYDRISGAVREKYPEIKLINSVTICSHEGHPEDGMEQAERTKTEYTDMHVYGKPEWFFANTHQFHAQNGKPGIFFGEYSSCDDGWYNALVEAAFMTGVENTDGINFICYAPLLNNVEYSSWHPNLIHYDNYRCYGIPSYHVQQMFMRNKGKTMLAVQDTIKHEQTVFPRKISGSLSVKVDLAEVDIKDFSIEKMECGERIQVQDFSLDAMEKEKNNIDHLDGKYRISFTFRRKEAPGTPAYRGRYALKVCLENEKAEDNVTWIIDGWQRITSINGYMGNYKTNHICEIKSQREYRAVLEVENNIARAYIDGVLCYTYENMKAVPEELYYSASKDEAGNVILRIVNVRPDEKILNISFDDGMDHEVSASIMDGYQAEDRNSLEEPQRVVPREEKLQVKNGRMEYLVSGLSAAVLRIHYAGEQD